MSQFLTVPGLDIDVVIDGDPLESPIPTRITRYLSIDEAMTAGMALVQAADNARQSSDPARGMQIEFDWDTD